MGDAHNTDTQLPIHLFCKALNLGAKPEEIKDRLEV